MVKYKEDGEQNNSLCWDASYEIVLALMRYYPHVNVDDVGVAQLKEMILNLPGFYDDPEIAHDGLIYTILREWYEEANADTDGI